MLSRIITDATDLFMANLFKGEVKLFEFHGISKKHADVVKGIIIT